jgi:hypothetical protein
MRRVTVARAAFLAVLLSTGAVGSDKTPHTYQKGTIKGWENRTDIWGAGTGSEGVPRKVTVFEWFRQLDLAPFDHLIWPHPWVIDDRWPRL